MSKDAVNNPAHYGGKDNPYEAIKVIDAWNLDFCLGNTVKYISRNGKKEGEAAIQDLKKAAWYLNHKIEVLEKLSSIKIDDKAKLLVKQVSKMRIATFDLEGILKQKGIRRDRFVIAVGENEIFVYFKDDIILNQWFPTMINNINITYRSGVGETVALSAGLMVQE